MRRSRTALAAALTGAALLAVLGGWVTTGWRSAKAEAKAVREAPAQRAAQAASELAARFGRHLEAVQRREDARPYFHYQNLYHDPRGASTGPSVTPSPLAEGPGDELIATHFEIDPRGRLTIPTVNEELPELSQKEALADNRALLETLRDATAELGADRVEVAKQTIQQVEPQAYVQNAAPNVVYQQIQAKTPDALPTGGSAIEVTTDELSWRTATIEGTPQLVALRRVITPDGTRVQGFLLDHDEARAWLAARAADDLDVDLAALPPDSEEAIAAVVPGVGDTWRVSVDPGAAMRSAAAAAGAIERGFWWRFVPAALLALACAALVVWIVARAEHLAAERSRFAAAAAHELRTPLAGLRLYGDMLADGLGDPERAGVYARRVADEAARLGRVVHNVLGFTQLERGALAVSPADGDAADATRRAIDRTRPALEHAGVTLEVDLPEVAPARFDDDAVQRILQNLLDNAEKYTRGRDPRTVAVSVSPTEAGVNIAVADDGAGVPRAVERRLFQPFTRGAGDDGPAGLGLGLALARALARAQDGDLRHTPSSRGTRFTLTLPAPTS